MVKARASIKDYFITGIFAILPLIITFAVLRWAARLAWEGLFSLAVPTTRHVLSTLVSPESMAVLERFYVPQLIGLSIMAAFLVAAGFVAKQIIGRSLAALLERVILAIPGVGFVYGTIRQFISTMDPESPQRDAFRKVVLVDIGRARMMGFLTSHSKLSSSAGKTFATVFIPCNQLLQGYNLVVEDRKITPLDMSVDDAFKYIVSFGMVAPGVMQLKSKAK